LQLDAEGQDRSNLSAILTLSEHGRKRLRHPKGLDIVHQDGSIAQMGKAEIQLPPTVLTVKHVFVPMTAVFPLVVP